MIHRAQKKTHNARKHTATPTNKGITTILIERQRYQQMLDNERMKNRGYQRTIINLRRQINRFKKKNLAIRHNSISNALEVRKTKK